MAESAFHEKLSIRESSRSLKKYGSTSNHMKRQESYVKHFISETDTLQGIALKYGVTMEQIRRTNKLWASDSLFLKEYLLIPVPADSPFSPSEERTVVPSNSNNNKSHNSSISESISFEEYSIDDFLENIDNSIANTKKEVHRSQGNSAFINEFNQDIHVRKKPAVSRLKQANAALQNKASSPPPDLLASSPPSYQHLTPSTKPATVPMVVTQTGRKLKSSLQRLEQQQDEMFEL